jgi:hypothetical protein
MDAAQRLQHALVEALHAERQAVDAGRAVATETPCFGGARVGFHRDFGVGLER